MSKYDDYYFLPCVSVAEKLERNAKMAAKLAKSNKSLKPVVLKGRTIASTFWGKAWCNNIESYQDFENRLPRGRSYVRSGAILDLQIMEGKITALVGGSASMPYKIMIEIQPLSSQKWEALKKKCVGKISSLLVLIQGKLSPEILQEFCSKETGLFPSPKEIKMSCSCPDYADLCKHLAAVLYGIGARLDEDPSLFFTLRKIDDSELIGADAASVLTDDVESEIANEDLENVFGVTFDELPETPAAVKTRKPPAKKDKAKKNVKKEMKWTGRKLIRLRKELGISPTNIAKHLGISVQTISNWEKGKYEIKPKYFEKLNKIFASE